MILKSIYKPEGGKLIRIILELHGDHIKDITICGDFFVHPEEGLEEIEADLIGTPRHEKDMIPCIQKTIRKKKIELFGITPESLARAIMKAGESDG